VTAAARRYLGVPYVFGGTDPATGLDCSGLVQWVYADLGITLPRLAHEQARVGTAVPDLARARPGDLLAFNQPVDHIAIYIGNGKMIAAPQPGENVKIQDVYGTPSAIRRVIADPPAASSSAPAVRPVGLGGSVAGSGVPFADLFNRAGAKHGVSPVLLAAVAKVESGFNPSAVSPAGAQGLMQIMPATAAGLGVNPLRPAEAVDGAARILAANLREFGSLSLALAAYNAGGGAVRQHGGIPPYAETQAYVPKVRAAMTTLG
jgi:soluble lytic murein transglycosylase-like protein